MSTAPAAAGGSAAFGGVPRHDDVEPLAGAVGGDGAVAVARADHQVVGVAGAGGRAVDHSGLAHRGRDLAGELRVGVRGRCAAVGDGVAVLVHRVLQGDDGQHAVVGEVLAGVDVDVAVGTEPGGVGARRGEGRVGGGHGEAAGLRDDG